MNQSKTDLGIVNESQLLRFGISGERLEEYIKPVGGGYFFVLPGVRSNGSFFGQGLFEVG
jgi:deferrochelatase/peroxidase EfeB